MEIETQEQLEKYIYNKMTEILLSSKVLTKEESENAIEKAYVFFGDLLYKMVSEAQLTCQDKLIE